ncbi:MAG: tetratricopeptide repeat protein, partial [Elusimicrobiota bacterium]
STDGDGKSVDVQGIDIQGIKQKARGFLQKYIDVDKSLTALKDVIGGDVTEKIKLKKQVNVYKKIMSFFQNSQTTSERPFSTEIDEDLATEFFNKAMQYYAKGELEKAKFALDKAHRLDPDNRETLEALDHMDKELATEFFNKAMQYYAKGELEKAKYLLDRAYKLDPDNQEILKAIERVEKDIAINK